MAIHLCDNSGPFDFSDPCVRLSWSTFLPATFVFALSIFAIRFPIPKFSRKVINAIQVRVTTYLTLHEAEALDADAPATVTESGLQGNVPLWRTLVFSFIGLFESLVWLAVGAYSLATDKTHIWFGVSPILIASTWLYATYKPIFWAKATVHYDLFSLYAIHLVSGVLLVGGALYEHKIFGVPLPPQLNLSALIVNLVAILVVLITAVEMPLALPSSRVKKEEVGVTVAPEDYTTLLGWITFSWVYPLVKKGGSTTMNEDDVWNLSVTMQSRPVFVKFSTIFSSSLIGRLWLANSLDILLDFFLTLITVVFQYGSPFFLKRILDAIDDPTPENRSRAYIYAFLAFLCTMCKAQADVQCLWFGRRAATRMRSELMAAIYDKALKRSDYSGIIDKDKLKEAADRKAGIDNSKNPTADDPKAGADVGKIVNLMAGDCNRVSRAPELCLFLFPAPLEIVIASVFLYDLLGISAFAGFVVLLAFWPLNSYVTKRSIRIQKGVSASRDKRMAVLNELISAVKFIKFFAWEERWIQRTMEARGVEMDWVVKARINSVMFSALWTSAPILVSLISFFTYVYRGNELTVSTAFTAIALFQMIREPLNIVPSFIVQALQTGVALKRIETYLNEDEVSDQVSSIKKTRSPANNNSDNDGLAIDNGTFKWNEVPEDATTDDGKAEATTKPDTNNSKASDAETKTTLDADLTAAALENEDHKFELRDISVRFPEAEL
ncbi:ABC transporter type 1, transmembrane domain-containing protein, partial [Hygrophoropsis aurantiaca]